MQKNVVGASPAYATPIMSFLTELLASIDKATTTVWWNEKHSKFRDFCGLCQSFSGYFYYFISYML